MALKTNNTARFNAIMNSRIPVSIAAHAGQSVRLVVTNANYGYYDEKNEMVKDLYNTNGLKLDFVQSQYFKEQYGEALAKETAGDHDGARMIFDDLMNKSTLTFSIINNGSGSAQQYSKDEPVNVMLDKVTSKEGNDSIAVIKAYPVKVAILGKSSKPLFTTEIEVEAPAAKSALAGATAIGA